MILFRAPRRGAPGPRERSSSDSELFSVRFGSDEWLYGKEPAEASRTRGAGEPIGEGRLHVVTQTGDAFERRYPRVRIIANYGRHLLVDLPTTTAERIRRSRDRCFRIDPVRGDMEIFRTAGPSVARRSGAAQVLVDAVSESELMSIVTDLAAFPTRHSTSASFIRAVEVAEKKLVAAGYAPRRETVRVGAKRSLNVIADKRGTAAGASMLMVTAHLDSVNSVEGPSGRAPGADDNGSGAAGVLEIARVLGPGSCEHDVRFILFGGEEQGLLGSTQYIVSLPAAERQRVAAVVNMDMIGTRNGRRRGVMIEGAAVSQAVIDAMSAAAAAYTTLEVTTSLRPFNSDHVPFIRAGIPAVLTIETGDRSNRNVHGPGDTVATIDRALLTAIVRMNTGFIAERAGART